MWYIEYTVQAWVWTRRYTKESGHMTQARQARTIRREQGAVAPVTEVQDTELRLSRWSTIDCPELAQLLADNEQRYVRSEHSVQYFRYITSQAFVAEVRTLAATQQ